MKNDQNAVRTDLSVFPSSRHQTLPDRENAAARVSRSQEAGQDGQEEEIFLSLSRGWRGRSTQGAAG